MNDDHQNCSHNLGHVHGATQGPRLLISLLLTLTFVTVEGFAGIRANSLALISDAGHNASDTLALGLAAYAVWIAKKPAAKKTMVLTNWKQIDTAMIMYGSDFDGRYARTRTSDNPSVPGYISWWSVGYYEQALNAYIADGKGGVNSSDQQGK